MKANLSQVMIVAAAFAVGQTHAFWGTAHMIIARQAQAYLEAENPTALASAIEELAVLKASHASIIKENEHPFTESAIFADTCKSQYPFQSGWHFVDQPYLDEGGSLDDFSFVADTADVVSALENITLWLSGADSASYESSTYYTQIVKYFPVEADAKSFALRMLIHYVGDVHQPLHAVAEVDSTYPSGDRGGNLETLPSVCGASNLHAMWDSVAYNYCGNPTTPLSSSDWTWYTNEAETMRKAYTISSSKIYGGDFQKWAEEGLDIAKLYVYPGVTPGKALDDAYVTKANDQTRLRMMYGARRLADIIVQIYGTAEVSDAFNFLQ